MRIPVLKLYLKEGVEIRREDFGDLLTSSMPEVGGDLVRYVSPYDASAMLQAIQELTNAKTRQKMEARIQAEFKPVTWQDSYESFVKALA